MPKRHRMFGVGKDFLLTRVVTLYDEKYLLTRAHAADFLDMSVSSFKRDVEPDLTAVLSAAGMHRFRVNDLVEWAARHEATCQRAEKRSRRSKAAA